MQIFTLMCGIAGIISPNPSRITHEYLKMMADAISHRGPDGEGFWISPENHVGFGHRRLSIIDPSAAAAQPMHFEGRYTIVFNGEIYNYLELREDLTGKGHEFRTRSNTEVILAAYAQYGEDCLGYFDGMFAFGIWDEVEQVFFGARDRFGEKPFFYFIDESDKSFYFASEMKGLWAVGIPRRIDPQALLYFLALGYTNLPVERERTFYNNIYSLPPAHSLSIHLQSNSIIIQSYWDLDRSVRVLMDEKDAIERFRELFFNSVRRRLRSDVEIGTSLSGGLDSSSIVAAASRQRGGDGRYKCFSANFPGFEKDESSRIKQVKDRFWLEAHFVIPGAQDCADNFTRVCYYQEQPFGSASIYAQYKVFELARKNSIKVLLDGQGADEILAGYEKYIHWWLQELYSERKLRQFRKEKREFIKNGHNLDWGIQNLFAAWLPGMAALHLQNRTSRRLKRNSELDESFVRAYYDYNYCYKPFVRELNDILYYDSTQSGLEQLLGFADRNSMAHGIEIRLPFLGHELVEFVFSIASDFKFRNGYNEWILRESMKDELPASIVWQTQKIGFEPPQMQWMTHPAMQELVHESRKKLVAAGILNKGISKKAIRPEAAFAADNRDWRYLVAGTLISI